MVVAMKLVVVVVAVLSQLTMQTDSKSDWLCWWWYQCSDGGGWGGGCGGSLGGDTDRANSQRKRERERVHAQRERFKRKKNGACANMKVHAHCAKIMAYAR